MGTWLWVFITISFEIKRWLFHLIDGLPSQHFRSLWELGKRQKEDLKSWDRIGRIGSDKILTCWTCVRKVSNWSSVQQTLPVIVGHKLWTFDESKSSGWGNTMRCNHQMVTINDKWRKEKVCINLRTINNHHYCRIYARRAAKDTLTDGIL